MKIGFDNDKYLQMQSEHIRERIAQFDNKLYLEFGGKLFDDYHASRVLPGFQPDSKLQMLLQLKDQAEVVIVINAEDIVSSKVRGDYGITYDLDVLRLIDAFQERGLFVGSVCVTMYTAAPEVEAFEKRLNSLGIRAFCVATAEEGAELRKNGVAGDILVLGFTPLEEMALARRYDLIQTAVDWEYARQLNELGVPIRVHVAVDTGMHRLGERWEHLERICAIYAMEHLRVEGIFTHLCADDTDLSLIHI